MKKSILFIAIISTFAACTSSPDKSLEASKNLLPFDSIRYTNSALTDVGTLAEEEVVMKPVAQKKVARKATRPVRQQAEVVTAAPASPVYQPVETPTAQVPAPVETNQGLPSSTGSTDGTADGTTDGTTVAKKKGWSTAAKGAVIGGVGGAIAGAVINGKNRGTGAVIGGVVGAAGGYILGRKKDKQSGRIDYSMNK